MHYTALAAAIMALIGSAPQIAQAPGWTPYDSGGSTKLFVRNADQKAKRIWLRAEFETPQRFDSINYVYSTELDEMDCQQNRVHKLQVYYYSSAGAGIPVAQSQTEGPWSYPEPGSVSERILSVMCHPTEQDAMIRILWGLPSPTSASR